MLGESLHYNGSLDGSGSLFPYGSLLSDGSLRVLGSLSLRGSLTDELCLSSDTPVCRFFEYPPLLSLLILTSTVRLQHEVGLRNVGH